MSSPSSAYLSFNRHILMVLSDVPQAIVLPNCASSLQIALTEPEQLRAEVQTILFYFAFQTLTTPSLPPENKYFPSWSDSKALIQSECAFSASGYFGAKVVGSQNLRPLSLEPDTSVSPTNLRDVTTSPCGEAATGIRFCEAKSIGMIWPLLLPAYKMSPNFSSEKISSFFSSSANGSFWDRKSQMHMAPWSAEPLPAEIMYLPHDETSTALISSLWYLNVKTFVKEIRSQTMTVRSDAERRYECLSHTLRHLM